MAPGCPLGKEKPDQCTWLPLRPPGSLGRTSGNRSWLCPPGSPSSYCPGSQWRGHWTSVGGSGLGTALSSHPPARCTWLQESRGGSVTSPAPTDPPPVTVTPRPDAACPSAHADLGHGRGQLSKAHKQSGPNPRVFSSPFLFVKPSKCIFAKDTNFCFKFEKSTWQTQLVFQLSNLTATTHKPILLLIKGNVSLGVPGWLSWRHVRLLI